MYVKNTHALLWVEVETSASYLSAKKQNLG